MCFPQWVEVWLPKYLSTQNLWLWPYLIKRVLSVVVNDLKMRSWWLNRWALSPATMSLLQTEKKTETPCGRPRDRRRTHRVPEELRGWKPDSSPRRESNYSFIQQVFYGGPPLMGMVQSFHIKWGVGSCFCDLSTTWIPWIALLTPGLTKQ